MSDLHDDFELKPISVGSAVLLILLAAAVAALFLGVVALIKSFAFHLDLALAWNKGVRDPLNLAFAQLAGTLLASGAGLFYFGRGVPLRHAFRIYPVRHLAVLLAFLGGLALQLPLSEVSNVMHEWIPLSVEEQLWIQGLVTPESWSKAIIVVFCVVVVPPISEELLFRGLLLPGFSRRYGITTAIVMSSLLFGVSHGAIVAVVYAATAGVVLGLVALRTGSTVTSIAMHGGVNALPLLLPTRVVPLPGFNTVTERVQHLPVSLVVASLAACGVCLTLLWKVTSGEHS